MGLFDRIFRFESGDTSRRHSGGKRPGSNSDRADPEADEAVQRHHGRIEESLREQESATIADASGAGMPASRTHGQVGSDGTGEIVARLRSHSDPYMRALAARTLGMMPKDAESVRALRDALHDGEPIVRDSARDVLERMGYRLSGV